MSGRGDSSPRGDRSPSPVHAEVARADRNDGYEANYNFQRKIQELDNEYEIFRTKLDSITVEESNDHNYTQNMHDWLKGCYHDMHQLDKRCIEIQKLAFNTTVPADRRRLLDQSKNINTYRSNIWHSEKHKTARDKFDKYQSWINNR